MSGLEVSGLGLEFGLEDLFAQLLTGLAVEIDSAYKLHVTQTGKHEYSSQ